MAQYDEPYRSASLQALVEPYIISYSCVTSCAIIQAVAGTARLPLVVKATRQFGWTPSGFGTGAISTFRSRVWGPNRDNRIPDSSFWDLAGFRGLKRSPCVICDDWCCRRLWIGCAPIFGHAMTPAAAAAASKLRRLGVNELVDKTILRLLANICWFLTT